MSGSGFKRRQATPQAKAGSIPTEPSDRPVRRTGVRCIRYARCMLLGRRPYWSGPHHTCCCAFSAYPGTPQRSMFHAGADGCNRLSRARAALRGVKPRPGQKDSQIPPAACSNLPPIPYVGVGWATRHPQQTPPALGTNPYCPVGAPTDAAALSVLCKHATPPAAVTFGSVAP